MPPLRIIIGGMVGQYPVGGVAWDYLQYVLGLARLGHDVFYHEDTWCWPYHPTRNKMTDDPRYSTEYLRNFFSCYAPDLVDHWHYLHLHETSHGMTRRAFDEVARTSDIFINISGSNFIPDALSHYCLKVFVDTDPGYNQLILVSSSPRSANLERWRKEIMTYDRHFTYGENIGMSGCRVPTVGFLWQKTRIPIVLDFWESIDIPSSPTGAWSTVMTWNVFLEKLEYAGTEFYGKPVEFEKIIDLPQRLGLPFRLALGGTEAPRSRLAKAGWMVDEGPASTLTPEDYHNYIAGSRGELSIAKDVYVALNTAWFSCRSACYLAAARPVVVQDTGFSRSIPTGSGLHAFTNVDQAAEAVEAIERDYRYEARTARALAHAYFDSQQVLTRLIDDALAGPL
jgi:hypothetical protein